jgi:hypothetical protein
VALVVASHPCAGVGVNVNHLAVAPDVEAVFVGLMDADDRVASGFERVEDRQREAFST